MEPADSSSPPESGRVRPPRIAIDAHMVGTRETGNETYVVQLASALARIGGYEYRLYTPFPQKLPPELREQSRLSVRAFPDVPAFVRIPVVYPRMAREDRVALLHMTYIAPPNAPCPMIVTVHDVSYRIYPQFFSPRVRLLLGLMVGPSIRRAARVITVSESAKKDIVRFYRVSPGRVAVTPEAAGPQYGPQSQYEIDRVRRQHRLRERYVLAVGNVQPRKNLPRLVEAFASVSQEVSDVELVIAGRSTWRGSEVEAAVENAGVGGKVRFIGYVPDSDLPALYAGAAVFCYPSLYEGFGLPPLEAMQCGTPTVTSNVASLPEVVGDAALTVDPTSVREIGAALKKLLIDEATWQVYRTKGLERAKLFTWERTARLTRDVYDQVLRQQTRRTAAG